MQPSGFQVPLTKIGLRIKCRKSVPIRWISAPRSGVSSYLRISTLSKRVLPWQLDELGRESELWTPRYRLDGAWFDGHFWTQLDNPAQWMQAGIGLIEGRDLFLVFTENPQKSYSITWFSDRNAGSFSLSFLDMLMPFSTYGFIFPICSSDARRTAVNSPIPVSPGSDVRPLVNQTPVMDSEERIANDRCGDDSFM